MRPSRLLAGLVARFGDDFVPDGHHKHSLLPGANLRRVRPETLEVLRSVPRIGRLMHRLGYSWA